MTSFDEGADLEFTMALEVLPEVPEVDLKKIELTRRSPRSARTIAGALDRFAKRFQEYEAAGRAAPEPDRRSRDHRLRGRIDGAVFEGGKAEDVPLVLGSGFMLPGFEEQLTGVEAGAEVIVEAQFPESYPMPIWRAKPRLRGQGEGVEAQAGRARRRSGQGTGLRRPRGAPERDRATASPGIRAGLAGQGETRAARPPRGELWFQVPAGMVELEFEAIWKQLKEEMERGGEALAEGKSEDELKEEYRAIAERGSVSA